MKSKHKTFPLENEQKMKDTIKKLQARCKKLERDNRDLVSKLSTLEQAFNVTKQFLKDNVGDFSVEDCISAAKRKKTLKQMVNEHGCENCNVPISPIILPHGKLLLCGDCGFRRVVKNEPN